MLKQLKIKIIYYFKTIKYQNKVYNLIENTIHIKNSSQQYRNKMKQI